MDDSIRTSRQPQTEPGREQRDRDTVHCENAQCREVFVVEHVGDTTAWTCPKCHTSHHNLHLHFVILGLATAFLALAGLAVLVVFLSLAGDEVSSVPYVIWSAVQIALALYVVLAVFSDARAYGLASLRVLIPLVFPSLGVFITLLAAKLWFPFLFIGAPVFVAGCGYVAWVSRHAFRMAEMHRPRETVVRPMYTLISIALHVIVLTMFTALFFEEVEQGLGPASIDFGEPGGYEPTMQEVDLEQPEEEIEIEEEEIETELEEIETPEIREIDYRTESNVTFTKIDPEDKKRIPTPRRRTRNVKYQQRYEREEALIEGGGDDRTERAVILALLWLRDHQNEDGSWGEDPYKPSMTGLALLCFLGHGEDHLSPQYGSCVRKALEWLKGHQDAEGFLAHQSYFAYQHGIATYALAEAYAMTELEAIKPVVKDAVEVILHGQTDEGGWYYSYTKGGITVRDYKTGREHFQGDWPGGDTSVSGWQIQALTAAFYAGIRFPNHALAHARKKALDDITSRIDVSEGWSGYQHTTPLAPYPEEDSPTARRKVSFGLTGVATLCLQFLGGGNTPAAQSMLNTMKRYAFSWEKSDGGWHDAPLYALYYVTQAIYHSAAPRPAANPHWMHWNKMMTTELLREQKADGSWGFPELSMEGKELVAGHKNKPVYATALCCLTLEVYYRYLPTYTLR